MPSPIGHCLAAVAVATAAPGLLRAATGDRGRLHRVLFIAALVFAANAPDLDFIPGLMIGDADRFHHGPTHSFGAALLFGLAAWVIAHRLRWPAPGRAAALLAIAYASHLLLDVFSLDRRPPNGVPLFWPLSREHFAVPAVLFIDIQRNTRARSFLQSLLVKHNFAAALWELVVMGLVLAVIRGMTLAVRLARGR